MTKNRLEGFSDGVLAIIITIMVLELKVPQSAGINGLKELLPLFCSYLLGFIYIGIYWNNHHHLFYLTKRVNGVIMWANLHLLFWLSLFPFVTAWVGKNHLSSFSIALYGFVALMAGCSFHLLERAIIADQGVNSLLALALGKDCKEKISLLCYLVSIFLAFVNTWIAVGLFIFVAFLWLVPDRRIENFLATTYSS